MSLTIAVSACLLGTPCRYDGRAKPCAAVQELQHVPDIVLVPICPEVAGSLPTPRPASEIQGDRVVNTEGVDVTAAFERGAARELVRAQATGCCLAILKAKSPSCGHGLVYDGSFSGALVPGDGLAAAALVAAGIPVINEDELAALARDTGGAGIGEALRALVG